MCLFFPWFFLWLSLVGFNYGWRFRPDGSGLPPDSQTDTGGPRAHGPTGPRAGHERLFLERLRNAPENVKSFIEERKEHIDEGGLAISDAEPFFAGRVSACSQNLQYSAIICYYRCYYIYYRYNKIQSAIADYSYCGLYSVCTISLNDITDTLDILIHDRISWSSAHSEVDRWPGGLKNKP